LSLAAAGVAAAQERVALPTQDSGKVHANVYGDARSGRGIVLAHGGRFNKESWAKQVPALVNAGYRVVAIDFRGYGQSTGPGQKDLFTAPLYYDVLAAVKYLQTSGVKSVSLMGGSMGGSVSADAMAHLKAGEIERLVLLGSRGGDAPEKIKARTLYIMCRDDENADGKRLPGVRADYEKTPDPKEMVLLECSAHAQFIFDTEHADRLMREILRFLAAS